MTISITGSNSTALVTGANTGIGKEVARQLAAAGLMVYVGSRTSERGQRAVDEIGANARLRIEGVVVESLHSRGVSVETGALQAVASRVGSKSAKSAKAYLEQGDFRGLDLSKHPSERQEAILVAVSVQEQAGGN